MGLPACAFLFIVEVMVERLCHFRVWGRDRDDVDMLPIVDGDITKVVLVVLVNGNVGTANP